MAVNVLRRRDPDLRTGVRVEHAVGLARDRGADHVRDGQRRRAPLPSRLDRAHRVRGLAGLGDRHDQRLGPEDQIRVAELGRHPDLGRQPGETLDHDATHERGVIRGAAGDQDDPSGPRDQLGGEVGLGNRHVPGLEGHPAQEGLGHRAGLLEDLLEHEVPVAALLGHRGVPGDAGRGALDRAAVERGHADARGRHHRHLAVFQEHHVAGVRQQGGDVGGHVDLALAEADHDRARAVLGHDELSGRVGRAGCRPRRPRVLRGARPGRRRRGSAHWPRTTRRDGRSPRYPSPSGSGDPARAAAP